MSFFPGQDPSPGDRQSCDALERVIVPRTTDLGDFEVRRALPSAQRRMVGPFVFLDEMGPAEFRAGTGVDVRPHPHIGLATVTYLFDGEITHRDSLGTFVAIRPGEVNWMTAGRGIVHSERTAPERRVSGDTLHGLQCWVALPADKEEIEPSFFHRSADDLPLLTDRGFTARVVAGQAFGARSPVVTASDTVFVDVVMEAATTIPLDPDYEERAIYIVDGEIEIAGDRFTGPRLLVFRPGDRIAVRAVTASHIAILGGAALEGPRHIWWNFVSSRKDRIEQAKEDWKAARFDIVPGDETEFIPLPER
jgi:redox-sensitive bicupin YhaK (pirin superfamily)